jgi:hypothetical protein
VQDREMQCRALRISSKRRWMRTKCRILGE